MMKNNTVVYTLNQKAYINLTNRCSNRCDFCIRNGRETFMIIICGWTKSLPLQRS